MITIYPKINLNLLIIKLTKEWCDVKKRRIWCTATDRARTDLLYQFGIHSGNDIGQTVEAGAGIKAAVAFVDTGNCKTAGADSQVQRESMLSICKSV